MPEVTRFSALAETDKATLFRDITGEIWILGNIFEQDSVIIVISCVSCRNFLDFIRIDVNINT